MNDPRIISIGTDVPEKSYTQAELAQFFGIGNPKIQRLFANSHIKKRHLNLPEMGPDGIPEETPEELNEKHRQGILKIGGNAINRALETAGLKPEQMDYLVCVTSTGYLCPGATALLIRQHGFRENIHRVDVVGMGCNAALNAMQPVVQFLRSNPDKIGMLVCIENCSAAYVTSEKMVTAVVNSLFGDAAAALVIAGSECKAVTINPALPKIMDFESQIVVEAMHTMRFDLENAKLAFYLDRDIPYFLGKNAHKPVLRLIEKAGLKKRDIAQWIVHSGGKKVIDSIKMNLDLDDHDVRHTLAVLESYGNISSCSILFSLKRLSEEGVVNEGDYGVMMAMGPGASIETALIRW